MSHHDLVLLAGVFAVQADKKSPAETRTAKHLGMIAGGTGKNQEVVCSTHPVVPSDLQQQQDKFSDPLIWTVQIKEMHIPFFGARCS